MPSFWQTLPRPFFAMAPMADVTDPAWRALVAKFGSPDIFWTEFVSADGLYHTRHAGCGLSDDTRPPNVRPPRSYIPDAENPLLRDLAFTEAERPIVAQIFSAKPEMIAYATKLVHELGFDGVDINMGCPDNSIEKQGCGAALMKTPKLAQELIRAATQAAKEAYENEISISSYRSKMIYGPMSVSVKTRVGYSREELDTWLPALLEAKPTAITLHLRTRKELSTVPANWELMKKAVEIRNRIAPEVLLVGNGDVKDLEDARAKARVSGADGIMLGRAMFGNPWVFAGRKPEDTPLSEKLDALIELAHAFEALRPPKHFAILKKHIKAFVTGFDGAAGLRAKLMEAKDASELETVIDNLEIKP